MAAQPLREWNGGLFDCFEDISTCCYGFWCCPCLAGTVVGRFGENRCLLLCDLCSPGALNSCGTPLFVPPAALSLRVAIRNRYGIKGSICKDVAASCFCVWCSWCQMHRELKHRNQAPTVVNMQPAPMVMVQRGAPPAVFMNQPGVIMTSY
ncbi:cornifelin homolog A-like [Lates japonicus]|uniref:Cornifelin homolog A-like protein n=1 Tax=Lates japonicus TaxID=270547 RepID=A0AAD3QZS3_LATJO|nr:cornifelin homolog A-like protein [Lates japonicus]